MLRLTKLKTYTKGIRRNGRSGGYEVEALDVKKSNPMESIEIPTIGYVLKPNEIYIAEVDNPGSPSYIEDNFVKELSTLGVSCKIVEDDCFITVQRPVKIYNGIGMFYEG